MGRYPVVLERNNFNDFLCECEDQIPEYIRNSKDKEIRKIVIANQDLLDEVPKLLSPIFIEGSNLRCPCNRGRLNQSGIDPNAKCHISRHILSDSHVEHVFPKDSPKQ